MEILPPSSFSSCSPFLPSSCSSCSVSSILLPLAMRAARGAVLNSGAKKKNKNPHSLQPQTDSVASLMQEGPDEKY